MTTPQTQNPSSANPSTSTGLRLRGVSTVRFQAADFDAAKQWYATLLGQAPYFERPGYAEFRFGDDQTELGLVDAKYLGHLGGKAEAGAAPARPSGAVLYWHVDDLPAALEKVTSMGATVHEPPRDFGHGFVASSVVDPFGNLLGLMFNPHYLEMQAARAH